jgi:molybdate transport repressor ModE-like protein
VTTRPGGAGGGGTTLTGFGAGLVQTYRAIEHEAQARAEDRLAQLEAALAPGPD